MTLVSSKVYFPLFALCIVSDCQMIHGDFLKTRTKDWRDADIVFANSTCYDEATMSKMSKIARKRLLIESLVKLFTLFFF